MLLLNSIFCYMQGWSRIKTNPYFWNTKPNMMKNTYILLLLLVSTRLFAQDTEKTEVQKTIETFFDGFHKQDSTLIKQTVSDKMTLQSIGMNREGKTTLRTDTFNGFLKNIVSIPETMKFEEKIKSYTIQVDGAMANAWTEYEFWINGKMSHCGVNSFQLFKDQGKWKIIYLIDTRRREECN